MRKAILGWLLFFGGAGIEFLIDYILRMRDANIRTGGFPEPLLFLLQAMLVLVSIFLLYQGVRSRPSLWQRVAIVSCQVAIGFVVYCFLALWYVTGTGIDSL